MAISNTLTGLVPILYSAAGDVSRELVGATKAVRTDFQDKMAAVNQTVRVPVSPAQSSSAFTPGAYVPEPSNRTITYVDVALTKNQESSFGLTGEDERALTSGGNDIANDSFRDSIAEAMRKLVNEVETDICTAVYQSASRAYGTAGDTPFSSEFGTTIGNVRKILDDNGASPLDRSLIINTAAGASLRGNSVLNKANEAGTDFFRSSGVLLDIHGFMVRESAGVVNHTAGTGSGYLVNNGSGEAVAQTAITVDGGTGTILAGDIVTFDGDTNKYCVNTALAAGDFSIGKPGLLKAAANDTAITVGGAYAANFALPKSAAVLITRIPSLYPQADVAVETVTDAVSGLSFAVVRSYQWGQVRYSVHLVWGVKVIRPEHVALLLG